MGATKIDGKDLRKLGFPQARVIGIALNVMAKHYKHESREKKIQMLTAVMNEPEAYLEDDILGVIAAEFIVPAEDSREVELLPAAGAYEVFGGEHIEQGAHAQMQTAMRLPVTVAGALMPDAHEGYGLPIGGVLAARNAVIPYGVGVDIGCRMALSVFDLPAKYIQEHRKELMKKLSDHTRFGNGSEFEKPMDHEIFSREEFAAIPIVRNLKDRAWKQIGSSGSGNHFVEFGEVEVLDANNEFGLAPGKYVGILSHSGSRGLGANIANYYTKLAMEHCVLPKEARHLAWLDLDSESGMEYWLAMNLAGDYASACHEQIHIRLAKAMGEKPVAKVENHHNFAWKEKMPDGSEVIVHRKGATPAGKGVLGIIPGSMTAEGFIVRGTGAHASLQSASHGAGRKMSRRKALETFTGKMLRETLDAHGVDLIGGGLDESPGAYKNIRHVMEFQKDLVEVVGTFQPRIVRMDS